MQSPKMYLSQYAQSITPQDLERHLRVIAHDSLEGRDTGFSLDKKKQLIMCANFFKSVGLQAYCTYHF
jgi:hypothetical protein